MLKRLLAVVVAGCLAFDAAPMTAFAKEALPAVTAEDSTEEAAESTEPEEDVEPADISGNAAPEDGGESAGEASGEEESSEEESIPEENPEETGPEESIPAEDIIPEPDADIPAEISEESGMAPEDADVFLELAEDTGSDVTPLKYGETNSVTAPYDTTNWYSFTAPEDGYYDFYASAAKSEISSYASAYLDLYDAVDGRQLASEYVTSSAPGILAGDSLMKAGDTLYLKTYHYSSGSGDVAVSLDVRKRTTFLTEREDGSYSYETEDYKLLIEPEAGYYNLRFHISMAPPEGKTLGNYSLQCSAVRMGSGIERSADFSALYPDRIIDIPVETGTEYKIQLILKDSEGNSLVLSPENGSLVMCTQWTEERLVVVDENTRSEMNQIVFDIDTSDYLKCYYAPADGSEEEKEKSSYKIGRFEWSFSNLQPDTEYYFQFTDQNGTMLLEKRVSTSAGTMKTEYRAEAYLNDSGQTELSLEADVSGYEGNTGFAYLYYEYTDALGRKQSGSQYKDLSEIADGRFTINKNITDAVLEADKQYDITVWIKLGDLTFKKEIKTITAPAAAFDPANLGFSVEADSEQNTAAGYTVQLPAESRGSIAGNIFYRPCGSQEPYRSKTVTLSSADTYVSGTISGLQAGGKYEFILFLGGVRKEQTVTLKDGSLKLTQIGDGETNAFDLVRTCRVESENPEELAEEYYLNLAYWSGSSYSGLGSPVVLNAENQYQAEIKTASGKMLEPDTDYHLRWTVSTTQYGSAVCTLYETVHTKKAELVWESVKSFYNEQQYKISLKEEDTVNFGESAGKSVYLYAYMRKTGETGYRNTGKSVYLSGDNKYSGTISFQGLTEETSYDISLRSNSGREYDAVSFTTPKDTRNLYVKSEKPGIHKTEINYAMDGIDQGMSGYVSIYIREKGAQIWEKSDSSYFNGPSTYERYFNITRYNEAELKENTVYEYQMGFGGSYNTPLAELERIVTGEFLTGKDTRSLSGAGISAGYRKAVVSALFSGGDIPDVYSYIYCFYKEKGKADWSRAGNYVYGTGYASLDCSWNLNSLKSGTAYDYAIVISEDWNCYSPDTVEEGNRKISGGFKTKECGYTLSFAVDQSKTTNSRAVVGVTAGGSTEDSRIEVSLTLSDGQQKKITLKQAEDYKKDVVFTDLLGGREYTIVSAAVSVKEDGSLVTIGELPCDYKFTTPEAQIPDTVTLSEQNITLNAAGGQNYLEGCNCITLKADVMPKTAAADFVWSSSDETVAEVSADGTVYGVGVGNAVITAVSAYDTSIKASCEVTVKNYVIGYQDEPGAVQTLESFTYNWKLYKGSSVKGIGYYEQAADGSLTLLQDYTVNPVKRNIVSWKDGNLFAENTGSTRIIFEKDGCRAAFTVTVTAAGKGFGIIDFISGNNAYPAVKTENGYILALADGIDYRATGKISPEQSFQPYDFNWSSSDPETAKVSGAGIVTPLKAGAVTITVTPKTFLADEPYIQEKVEVKLDIRELPAGADNLSMYALANVSKKLGDVKFPKDWESGWSWKYPDTPLVTNGVNKESYAFEAVYGGDRNYPVEKTINIYIGKITAVSVSEIGNGHNQVLEAGGNDSIELAVSPVYQGKISKDEYTVEFPAVQGLTVTKNDENGTWLVTAQKKGNYTLNPVIKSGDTVLAKTSYKIKAVEEKQVGSITFTTDTEGVTIDGNTVIFDASADRKDFILRAEVKDRYGEDIQTALQWKTTDKAVAAAAPESKDNTHTAKVSVKEEGHAVIMVNAKDAAGLRAELNVEIRNHMPRIDTDKAVVNIAYDYSSNEGKAKAVTAGAVEIVPVYGEAVSSVRLYDQNGDNEVTDLKIDRYNGYKYLIEPAEAEIRTGVYDCTLRVQTTRGTVYDYTLKVTVVDNAPTVSAKMGSQANLFFTYTTGQIDLAVSGSNRVRAVSWEDASAGAGNGFTMAPRYRSSGKIRNYVLVSQQNIKMQQGSLVDPLIAKGKLTVRLEGYRKEYTFDNFEIKYQYKKPVLVTKSASSSIAPAIGLNSGRFYLFDNTNKRYLYYQDSTASYCFDEIECDSTDMEFRTSVGSSEVNYTYSGEEGTKKLTLTVDSEYWREPLKAGHTVKAAAPKAYLSTGRLTYNTAVKSTASVYVHLKNMNSIDCTDIVIEGANAKSQKLLDDDLFVMTAQGNRIEVKQSQADLMKSAVPKGSYSYKITPYYGETALNTMKLTIKVVDKPVTAKISPKGSLDLANGTFSSLNSRKNVVVVDPKFSNMSDGCYVSDYKLTGEYSEYFDLDYDYQNTSPYGYHYYISIRSSGKLKAGQTYKLAVQYTVTTGSGERFTVTSNTFKIKPKQSKAKVKIVNNNQTLYAASEMSRSYSLSVPAYYTIESASGSLDCNKDGKADIVVSGGRTLTVRITDQDAVGASVKGKAYSIPVTVRLQGRDGISMDVNIKVKVKIKR